MAAEQRVSASVFSHRGDAYDANTNNFILDGRQLFSFEPDNSHVSIEEKSRDFFFAVCDTKPTDNLNASVSGIKELKKIYSQFKGGARDIKSRTEMLGECFINTESLLYDSGSYAAPRGGGQPRGPKLASLDIKLPNYAVGVQDDAEDDAAQERDGDDGYGAQAEGGEYRDAEDGGEGGGDGRYPEPGEPDDGGGGDGDVVYADDGAYGDEPADETPDRILAPGEKGFSTVGFILSEKKGSILAQGECEAFLLRSGALRVLSGGGKKSGASLGRAPAAGHTPASGAQRQGASRGYAGRASEIFEPREGDVYLLCTSSVIDAVGEENIDSFLAMRDGISVICGAVMNEAVKNDPSSNMTCMLVRIEESREDEAMISPLQRRPEFSYGNMAGLQGRPAAQQQQQQQMPPPEYPDQDGRDTRIAMRAPYQNNSAFTKRAASRFEPPPPRKAPFAGKKSLVPSIATTAVLLLVLFVSYMLWLNNSGGDSGNGRLPTATPRNNPLTTTSADEDVPTDEYDGEEGDEGDWEPTTAYDEITTTVAPTTEPTTTAPQIVMYTVKSGDTLSNIAQSYYGNAQLYTIIQDANGITNPANLRIGQELIIPPKPDAATTTAAASSSSQDAGAVTVSRQSTQ
jgi:nucleoid-associated protein YgaU